MSCQHTRLLIKPGRICRFRLRDFLCVDDRSERFVQFMHEKSFFVHTIKREECPR